MIDTTTIEMLSGLADRLHKAGVFGAEVTSALRLVRRDLLGGRGQSQVEARRGALAEGNRGVGGQADLALDDADAARRRHRREAQLMALEENRERLVCARHLLSENARPVEAVREAGKHVDCSEVDHADTANSAA